MDSLLEIISNNYLFETLDQPALESLAQAAICRTYAPGEILVNQGDVWPNLFLVTAGEINAVKESLEGRVLVATTLAQGEAFWGLAFFIDQAEMPVMLQANTAASLCLWSRDFLEPAIKQNGQLSWRLCQIMIERMQMASGIVDELAFQPVMGRLSGLLLEYFGDAEESFKARILTLEDMAARIGSTREMVSRTLNRMVQSGAIEVSRTELRITDRSFLERQARR